MYGMAWCGRWCGLVQAMVTRAMQWWWQVRRGMLMQSCIVSFRFTQAFPNLPTSFAGMSTSSRHAMRELKQSRSRRIMWEWERDRKRRNTCGTLMPPLHVRPPPCWSSIIIVFIITNMSLFKGNIPMESEFPDYLSDELNMMQKNNNWCPLTPLISSQENIPF